MRSNRNDGLQQVGHVHSACGGRIQECSFLLEVLVFTPGFSSTRRLQHKFVLVSTGLLFFTHSVELAASLSASSLRAVLEADMGQACAAIVFGRVQEPS